jgi:hypothetical protein
LPVLFYITFGSNQKEQAELFGDHLLNIENPPVKFVAFWGSWFSIEYNNAKCWFVEWLCENKTGSNAISDWEVAARTPETAGVSYGSQSSPLSVGFKLEKIAEHIVRGPEWDNLTIKSDPCVKCGFSDFEYDDYWKEYIYKKCGWIFKDKKRVPIEEHLPKPEHDDKKRLTIFETFQTTDPEQAVQCQLLKNHNINLNKIGGYHV